MARSARHLTVLVALAVAVAVAGCGSTAVQLTARPHRTRAPSVRRGPAVYPTRSVDLAAARAGIAHARAWWDPHRRWYDQYLPATGRTWRATLWGIVHLFGAYNAVAIADPSRADVAAARRFGIGAERYWNPALRPVPGYSRTPPGKVGRTWYDDEGWWGVAQFDAYRATHDRRFLADAARSLRFIDSGWDPVAGGIWWNDLHAFKASESLAGGTLTAAGLFEATRRPRYLALARKYIGWADRTIRAPDGLYGARSSPRRPMPYVEGPMAEAFLRLCHATGRQAYCRKGEHLLRVTAARFPNLTMGPQFDAIYLRSLLEAYRIDHNPRWYRIAASVGAEALTHAARPDGLFLRNWDGRPIGALGTPANKLQTHAATTSVLAWLAAAKHR
ncbi:MAG: glycoside hydrolase family 76 protein [Solirubrobacteraceae bacterium]